MYIRMCVGKDTSRKEYCAHIPMHLLFRTTKETIYVVNKMYSTRSPTRCFFLIHNIKFLLDPFYYGLDPIGGTGHGTFGGIIHNEGG